MKFPSSRGYAWLALIAGLLCTGYLGYTAKSDAELISDQRFAANSDEVRLHLIGLLEAHKQVLMGCAALFSASREVERDEWKAYVDHLRLDDHFKGIQGVGFALWIPRAQLERHIAEIRQQGFPNYSVYPQGERAEYSSIIYLEPFEGRNLRAFGYDMYSEPVRRMAMEQARDKNRASLSGKVRLVQETSVDTQAGTLMYVPVYRQPARLDSVAERREALMGWVYSPFRMDNLLNEALSREKAPVARDMHLQIFDGPDITPEHLLYSSEDHHLHLPLPGMLTKTLEFDGREWTLLFEKNNAYAFGLDYSKTWWISLGGIFSSILLFFLIRADTRLRNALQDARVAVSELRKSEESLRVLAKNESVMVWLSGPNGECTHFNQVWLDFTGRALAEEIGDGWSTGVHPDDLTHCLATYSDAFAARREFTMEYRLRRHDGEYRWIVDHGVPRTNEQDEFIGYIGSCVDISERKQAELKIQLTQFAMDNAFDEIFWLDRRAHICYINNRACETLGYSREELLRLSIPDLDPQFPLSRWDEHWASLQREKSQFFETRHRRKDGSVIPVEISANYVKFDDQEYNIAFCRDISRRKLAEEEIHTLAYYDALTQLPNRRLLHDRLTQALAASKRNGQYGALLFLDLDNFKPLNDSCGHEAGDLLLAEVANRITRNVREIDTVARFGGDEFIVLLGELAEDRESLQKQAGIVAEKIRAVLAEPFDLQLNQEGGSMPQPLCHRCSSSIGVTLFDGGTDTPKAILMRGDAAMYQAKAAGRNQVCFHT